MPPLSATRRRRAMRPASERPPAPDRILHSVDCPSCAAAVPPGARFCPACGQAVSGDENAAHEERRIATVLFADLVGFTSLSESADPEQIKNLVDSCFERLVADIEAFGGRIDKIIGDALVALFGAPVAHEDDPERAVRAALQMQATLAALRDDIADPIEMRIGVNTGEVLTGAFRSGGDYTAMGDAVNVASRLEGSAQPGQVLVGPLTYEATEHAVAYKHVGELNVKGREAPVEAWIATEPLTRPGDRRARPAIPLVGRASELELIGRALDLALGRGRPALLVLTGEAGVGKHRLAHEISERVCLSHGAVIGHGRSSAYGELSPTAPVADALLELVGVDATDDSDTARRAVTGAIDRLITHDPELETSGGRDQLLSGVLTMTGLSAPPPGADGERVRNSAVATTVAVLHSLSRLHPVVLTLSSMHWADDAALNLCDRLIAGLQSSRCVFLVAGRPELRERWQPASGRHVRLDLEVEPLDAAGTRDLATAVLGSDPGKAAANDLHERTGGNPFFIEELASLLRDSQDVSDPDAAVGGPAPALPTPLPSTLHGIVAARLDELSEDAHAVVEDAAVIGTRGPVGGVTALAAARSAGRTSDVMGLLDATDLVSLEDGDFTFRSDVVREVAYGRLTKTDRARRHAWHADWLEGIADVATRPGDVRIAAAHHLGIAAELAQELGPTSGLGDVGARALDRLRSAANQAAAAELWITLEHTVDRALRLAEDTPDQVALRLQRAEARANRRRVALARDDIEFVLEHSIDPTTLAAAHTRLGDIEHKEGNIGRAADTLDAAVDEWRSLGDVANAGHALRLRGHVEFYRGDIGKAAQLVTEALECFREADDQGGEAWAVQNLALFAFLRGDLVEADVYLTEASEAFEELDDWGGLAWSRGLRAWLLFASGDLDGAEHMSSSAGTPAAQIGDRFGGAMNLTLRASIAMWRGDATRCLEQATTAVEEFRAISDAWGEATALRVSARARLARGDIEEAFEDLERVRKLDHVRGAAGGEDGFTDDFAILMLALAGRPEEALKGLRRRTDDDVGERLGAPEHLQALSLALLQTGSPGEAATVLGRAGAGTGDGDHRPSLDALLVMALLADGRLEEAQAAVNASGDGSTGTYRDRIDLAIAAACAAVARRDPAAATSACDRALEIAAETDAVVDRTLVDLAVARVRGAVGGASGEADALDARKRLTDVGIEPDPWDRVYSSAVGRRTD